MRCDYRHFLEEYPPKSIYCMTAITTNITSFQQYKSKSGQSSDYKTPTGYRLGGTVGPQGELTMQSAMVGGSRPARMQASGNIDASGTAHVRQMGSSCSYDFVWKK